MAETKSSGASLAAGLVLLAISSVNIGYGLCMLVHDMDGAAPLMGIGAAFAGLSTIFIARSQAAAK